MQVRFFNPDMVVLASRQPALREAVRSLNRQTLELPEAVKLIQAAAPNAIVGAFAGFIAIRENGNDTPRPLIRYAGAEDATESLPPLRSFRTL